MLTEKENREELLDALDGIQSELRGIKRKSVKQVFQIIAAALLKFMQPKRTQLKEKSI